MISLTQWTGEGGNQPFSSTIILRFLRCFSGNLREVWAPQNPPNGHRRPVGMWGGWLEQFLGLHDSHMVGSDCLQWLCRIFVHSPFTPKIPLKGWQFTKIGGIFSTKGSVSAIRLDLSFQKPISNFIYVEGVFHTFLPKSPPQKAKNHHRRGSILENLEYLWVLGQKWTRYENRSLVWTIGTKKQLFQKNSILTPKDPWGGKVPLFTPTWTP